MACANRFDDAAGYVILSTAGVCLIHRVELTTTTLNLEDIRLDYLTDNICVHLFHGGSS